MHISPLYSLRTAFSRTLLPVLLSGLVFCLTAMSSLAQNKEKLPDSVSTAVEEVSSGKDFNQARDTNQVIQPLADTVVSAESGTGHAGDTTTARDTLTYRAIPDSVILRFKNDPEFAYANDPAYWKEDDEKDNTTESPSLDWLRKLLSGKGFKIFMYLLFGGILAYALFRIIKENDFQLFFRSARRRAAAATDVPELPEEDLDASLRQAMQDKNYRLGVRYLFLKALNLLSEQGLIRYHAQSTNQEYVNQLNGTPQAKKFQFLTGAYDHVWYGDFALNEQQFEGLFQYFQDFYKTIHQ